MLSARISLFFVLLNAVAAEQPSAPSPIAAPLRELPWGQINFLHTTDTHGWHGGHLQEAQYSADWGDYVSFAHHLHERADKDGSDLLLVDTGDRVEGNGLYDASDPKGKYSSDIIKAQAIDLVTVGNHELYHSNTSAREFSQIVPDFKNSYIASNLDIYAPKTGERTALAARFRKFTTKNQGIRVLAFGFLFNFKGNANNTVVQPVEETIQEQWFKDAIADKELDLFLVAGHVPVRDAPELEVIYKAIRRANRDTPIVFFGGHTHIRDYRRFETKAWALESGRYMETLGFLSISGLNTGRKDEASSRASIQYKRLYIDNNLFSLHHHSGTNKSTFDTELGRNVSKAITAARKDLQLDRAFGCAPHDYWLSRTPYPSDDSLLSWLEREVLPDTFEYTKTPSIVITNTGAIRFDIFKGPFTADAAFLVSPFTSGFRTIKNVPFKAASQVLRLLNDQGPILLKDLAAFGGEGDLDQLRPPPTPVGPGSLAYGIGEARLSTEYRSNALQQSILAADQGSEQPRMPGYTTKDDAGDDGDDTIHQPIQFYRVPNCIAANVNFPSVASAAGYGPSTSHLSPGEEPGEVDLVYNEFIQKWVLQALEYLGEKREAKDSSYVMAGKSMADVLSDWVEQSPAWRCAEGGQPKGAA